MKKYLAIVLIVLMLFSVAGCAAKTAEAPANTEPTGTPDSEPASKSLVVYCPHPVEFINPIISEFEASTGIQAEVITAGTGELLKRVEAEQANPLGDVFWGGSLSTISPKMELFENYLSANEGAVFDDCKNTEGMMTRFTVIPSVLMINTKLIGDIEVNGYEDVLNPALKGKIAFADPSKSSSSFEHLVNMLYAMGNGDTDSGWDYVTKLSKHLDGKLLSGSSAVYKGVADGEYTVGLTFEEGAAKYVKDGAPVKVVYMEEGTISKPDTVQIIKGAKNMDNAKTFIDFVTSKETQTLIANELCRRSVRNDVPAGNGLTPTSEMKLITDDPNVVNPNKQVWLDKFKDIYTSN
ncbi:MAG: ABC transporter substrate-binding protein [Clostridia bacterium BRH_c25]|nr:MAG: ABC transporter substrate-binding protein [Clostridia bacterium BRH_c25]